MSKVNGKSFNIGKYRITVKKGIYDTIFGMLFVIFTLATFSHILLEYFNNFIWINDPYDIRYVFLEIFCLWVLCQYIIWVFEIKEGMK